MTDPNTQTVNIFTPNKQIIVGVNISLDDLLFASILNPPPEAKDFVINSGLNYRELSFGEMPLLVISRFKFYKKIKKAVTPSSGAYYLLWHEESEGSSKQGFLLQYLPPKSVTSKHFHTEQTESFNLLEGTLFLETSEGNFQMKAGDEYTAEPKIVHQLRTEEIPSLTVIDIQNVNYKDHHIVGDSNGRK